MLGKGRFQRGTVPQPEGGSPVNAQLGFLVTWNWPSFQEWFNINYRQNKTSKCIGILKIMLHLPTFLSPPLFFFFFFQIELDIHVSLTLSVSHRLPPGTMGSLDAPTTLVSCSSPKAPWGPPKAKSCFGCTSSCSSPMPCWHTLLGQHHLAAFSSDVS